MVSIFILQKTVAEEGRLQLFSICCNFGQIFCTEVIQFFRVAMSNKELSCAAERHLDNFMQLLTNSGYDEKFRAEILNLGLKGFDKIVKAERDGVRPMFRPKRLLAGLPKGRRGTTLMYH